LVEFHHSDTTQSSVVYINFTGQYQSDGSLGMFRSEWSLFTEFRVKNVDIGFYPDFYFIVQFRLSGMETRPIGRQVRYTTPTP